MRAYCSAIFLKAVCIGMCLRTFATIKNGSELVNITKGTLISWGEKLRGQLP